MSMTKRPKRQYSCEIINLEDMVPKDHFLRVIDEYFDWNFVYEEVEKLYSKLGRKSIDPVVLIKIHILKFLFHEDSLRRTYENLKYNNLYRWFIGYNLNEEVPNHSTYSQNYKRKFCKLEKDLLQTVFDKVIELLINWNCLDMTAVYIDSTHTKASANKKKNHNEMTNDYRHHSDVKDIYKQRPQCIERVFAKGKMKYGLRYTYFRTKERVHRESILLYACMNLKKFSLHHYV